MNVGVITKIEYRKEGEQNYTYLTFSGFSAGYSTEIKKTKAGHSHHLKINCKIPRMDKNTSDTLSALLGERLNIKFRDGNNNYHYAGNSAYPARLIYKEIIEGDAGEFNGYEVTITQDSPGGHTISPS